MRVTQRTRRCCHFWVVACPPSCSRSRANCKGIALRFLLLPPFHKAAHGTCDFKQEEHVFWVLSQYLLSVPNFLAVGGLVRRFVPSLLECRALARGEDSRRGAVPIEGVPARDTLVSIRASGNLPHGSRQCSRAVRPSNHCNPRVGALVGCFCQASGRVVFAWIVRGGTHGPPCGPFSPACESDTNGNSGRRLAK